MTDNRHRWVLLHHEIDRLSVSGGGQRQGDVGRGDHFDLMLSLPGSSPPSSRPLWTWAIPTNPLEQSLPLECEVDRLPDHRRVYLDYEGPISGDRGQVRQSAKGTFEVVAWSQRQVNVRLWLGEAGEHTSSFLVSLTSQGNTWRLSWSAPD